MLTRRGLVGSAALAVAMPPRVRAQPAEVVIGALFPLSGPSAQIGADAKIAIQTAVDIINGAHPDLDLPLAKEPGLPGLGGARIRVVLADHAGDPQKGRAEAERLVGSEKAAALLGTYQSAVAATVSQAAERLGVPFMSADNSSPSLHRRGLRYYFRAAAHDEMFSAAMFDFMDMLRAKGEKIETLALVYEDKIFGTDSSNVQRRLAGERGYRVISEIRYRADTPSLVAEVKQLKAANADVLMPTSYTADSILLVRAMSELGWRPKGIIAQAAGMADRAFFDAVGPQVENLITRGSFSLDLARKRPSVGTVNAMFKARSGKDLNDNTSRELTGLLLLCYGIDRAGSLDGTRIRDALAATDLPGEKTIMPWRRVTYEDTGQNPYADPVLLQYRGGTSITVFPPEVTAAQAVWPMSRA